MMNLSQELDKNEMLIDRIKNSDLKYYLVS